MTQKDYIEQEVKIRLHEALFNHMDYKFNSLEKRLDKIQGNNKWIMTLLISGLALPMLLKHFGI